MKIVEVKSYLLEAAVDTPFFFSQPGMVRRRSSMDGMASVSKEPGIGAIVNRAVLEKHSA